MKGPLVFVFLALFCGSAAADPEAAAAYSAAHGEKALLVVEGRLVILERGSAVAPRVFSITKSLVSIGVFRDASLSLEHLAVGGAARGVRFADLLNRTSGLASMSAEFYSTGLKDKERVLKSLGAPKSSRGFVYGASHWEVLAGEIAVAGGRPLEGWLRRYVPGMRSVVLARWRRDGQGRPFFSTGARLSPRELLPAAREVVAGVGRGQWPPKVRSLLASGTPQNRMYALGFWLNREAREGGAHEVPIESSLSPPPSAEFWRHGCLSRSAPSELLAMVGSGGQRVYIVPSRGLIIIRLAAGGRFSDAEFLRRYFAAPKAL